MKNSQCNVDEMTSTLQVIDGIVRGDNPFVKYRDIEPVADMKYMLNRSSRLFGTKVAFKIKEGNEKNYGLINYKALSSDVNALGTFLVRNGLKGKKIAILGENSYEWVVAYLSAICGTGVAVPLNKGWSLNELKRYTNATDCECIIFSEAFEDVVWELYNDGVTFLQTFICMRSKKSKSQFVSMEEAINEGEKDISLGNRDFLDTQFTGDDLAVIQFTTEVSEDPKPVMLTHGNIAALLMSLTSIIHIDDNDVFFSTLFMSSPLENIVGLLLPLFKGASMTLQVDENIEDILRDSKTSVFLASQREIATLNLRNYGSLRVVLYGDNEGEPQVLRSVTARGLFVAQAYILPQCCSIVALNPSYGYADGSVGRTIPGVESRIADADPQTGIGEICFRGPTVATGYYSKLDYDTPIYNYDIREGWYYTSRMGTMDENSYIYTK